VTGFDPAHEPEFPIAARLSLADSQVRKNVRHATTVIQNKRAIVVKEQTDWQELRESAKQVREHTFKHLAH
jgi:L-lactate dehydrogenase complex protein LldF